MQIDDPGRVYRRLLGYARPHLGMFGIGVLGMTLFAATDSALAYLVKVFLGGAFVEPDPRVLWMVPLGAILLFTLRGIGDYVSNYFPGWVGRQIIKSIRAELFAHYLRLPTRYYDAAASGQMLSRLTYNVELVAEATTNAVTVLIRDTLTILGLLGMLFWFNWQLAAFALTLAPLISWLIQRINRLFRRYSTRIQNSMGDVTRVAKEALDAQPRHQGVQRRAPRGGDLRDGQRAQPALQHAPDRREGARQPRGAADRRLRPGRRPVFLDPPGVHARDARRRLHGLPDGPAADHGAAAPPGQHLRPAAAGHRGRSERVRGARHPGRGRSGGGRRIERARGEVEFRDVGFTYSRDKGVVLQGVGFRVAPGQTVAIVGKSGSGKSTLVSLVPRFYDPDAGAVLLDGVDVRDYGRADLRNQVSLVSQDVVLFNDSIRNNIRFSMSGMDDAAVEAAAVAAFVMDFVRELPDGLDTVVGDRGALLSGGQRQRISIARALLKNAPVLILDEATSALDTESERRIQAALARLVRNRTTLVIAHRLSTIEQADLIVVLDERPRDRDRHACRAAARATGSTRSCIACSSRPERGDRAQRAKLARSRLVRRLRPAWRLAAAAGGADATSWCSLRRAAFDAGWLRRRRAGLPVDRGRQPHRRRYRQDTVRHLARACPAGAGPAARPAVARLWWPRRRRRATCDPVTILARSATSRCCSPRRVRLAGRGGAAARGRRRAPARAGRTLVICDDGLQHYALARDLEIALVDAARGLGNGRMLPAGPLREPPSRLARVDFVVLNGAGEWRPTRRSWRRRRLFSMQLAARRGAPACGPVKARPLAESFRATPVHAVAGIGHPARFFATLRAAGLELREHAFPDHHAFRAADFEFGDALPVLMTSKDAVKCRAFADARLWELLPGRAGAHAEPGGGQARIERVAVTGSRREASQTMDTRLLEILACPVCKGPLVMRREPQVLVCRADRLAFPVRDGIPVMLEDEARQLASDDPLLER